MNSDYYPLQKFVGREISDKLKANIKVSVKGNMYLYNYNNKVIVKRNNPILIKCRGLVLDYNGNVLNYPFDRFFNSYERESVDIDWDSAKITEKIDGSLVCVFWNGKDWEVTTRGSFYPNPYADIDYAQKFKSLFDEFDKLEKTYCYMFEMCSNDNRIVKWYDEEFVALIGMRNLRTLNEIDPTQESKYLGVRSPKSYKANNLEECKKLFSLLEDDDEGFVIVDVYYNRIKVKQDSYLALSKIKMLKEDDILEYVLSLIHI